MNIFTMKDWKLTLDPQVWGLTPFKKLLDRDKTKDKVRANSEMLYIWYFTDIRSDFLFLGEKERTVEIIKNLSYFKEGWEPDNLVEDALKFYRKMSETPIQRLYKQALIAVQAVGDQLENSEKLLNTVDPRGNHVYKIRDITQGLRDVKTIVRDLKETEREVIKEIKDNEGKSKGSQKFNMFEQGLF